MMAVCPGALVECVFNTVLEWRLPHLLILLSPCFLSDRAVVQLFVSLLFFPGRSCVQRVIDVRVCVEPSLGLCLCVSLRFPSFVAPLHGIECLHLLSDLNVGC